MNRAGLGCLLDSLSKNFLDATWLWGDELLSATAREPLSAGLLPLAAQTVRRYVGVTCGDSVLVKDVSAGAPGPQRMALVTRGPSLSGQDLWIATSVVCGQKQDLLPMPMIPLSHEGEINTQLLRALGEDGEVIQREWTHHRGLLESLSHIGCLTQKKWLQNQLNLRSDGLKDLIADLPEGTFTSDLKIPSGEDLRLKLECDGKTLRFEVSGTNLSKKLGLNAAATAGIVRATVREWLSFEAHVDRDCSERIPVSVPQGHWLSTPDSDLKNRDLRASAAWLQTAIEKLLHRWDRRHQRGLTNYFDLNVHLTANDGRGGELVLPAGSPAHDGLEGQSFWRQRRTASCFSIESLERKWPVKVLSLSLRPASNPATPVKLHGGRGLQLVLECQSDLQLHWSGVGLVSDSQPEIPLCSEVMIRRQGSDTPLSAESAHTLKAGDQLILTSGSGGSLP